MWLGIGDALSEAVEKGQLPLLQTMYDEWPFFKGLLDLVEMVMAKADPRVTAMYDAKLVRPELQVRGLAHRLCVRVLFGLGVCCL